MRRRYPWISVQLLALGAVGHAALAQQPSPEPPFQPRASLLPPFEVRPGAKEFSGRLIARPRQPADMAGLTPDQIQLRDVQARSLLLSYRATYVPEVDQYVFDVPPGSSEDALASQLLETGLYQWVRPDWLLYPCQAFEVRPNDPLFNTQWHLGRIQAPAAWNISAGSPTVVVAVVDTGVDFTHPDLAGNMVLGYCSHITVRRAQTVNPPWNTVTMDSVGHGTGIAGVLGAVANNDMGISGVAWNLRVMPIKASSPSGSATVSIGDIQNGAIWAATNGARVISVSAAGIEEPLLDSLGRSIRSRNALLVWAMDNSNSNRDPAEPPLDFQPNITVVSGSGLSDEHWCSFVNPGVCSSYGQVVDIAAPAYGVAVTTIGGGYSVGEGVSYAAPMVTAALGMIWSVAPSLSPDEAEQVLLASADDIGAPGKDAYFGHGRLNLRRALWNAVIRQYATALPPAAFNEQAFSIDDVYEFILSPMDVTGDGIIDEKEQVAVQGFMRRKEFKDLVADRP